MTASLLDAMTALGCMVRDHVWHGRLPIGKRTEVIRTVGSETIFGLDESVEGVMLKAIAAWPADLLPVALVAEGLERVPTIVGGGPGAAIKHHVLVDPIDGTRGLMYGKRSAYFLAAATLNNGVPPSLGRTQAAVAVEIPTEKQSVSDVIAWEAPGRPSLIRQDMNGGASLAMTLEPSREGGLSNRFGSVVDFFFFGKKAVAELSERIARECLSRDEVLFDDQYISTGGQMLSLLQGSDQFVIDVRPLLPETAGRRLCAHPYDLAVMPLARAGGVLFCDPFGRELDVSYGVDEDVAWCGYANLAIKELIQPIVTQWSMEKAVR